MQSPAAPAPGEGTSSPVVSSLFIDGRWDSCWCRGLGKQQALCFRASYRRLKHGVKRCTSHPTPCLPTRSPAVGQTLQVAGSGDAAAGDSMPLQWLRLQPGNAAPHVISGAVRPQVCSL